MLRTWDGSISGSSATGIARTAISPVSTAAMERTKAILGRLMKNQGAWCTIWPGQRGHRGVEELHDALQPVGHIVDNEQASRASGGKVGAHVFSERIPPEPFTRTRSSPLPAPRIAG